MATQICLSKARNVPSITILWKNGTVHVTKYETDLSNNAIVISRGVSKVNFAQGMSQLHYYSPSVYTRTLRCFAGDLITYFMCYSCNDCSNFGEENVGSKWKIM